MSTKKLRLELMKLTPAEFRKRIRGARERELTARHLLLHLDKLSEARPEDLSALDEYVKRGGWRSLYGHDRRMYRMLRAGAERYLAGRR
jgi:hypothetical protein